MSADGSERYAIHPLIPDLSTWAESILPLACDITLFLEPDGQVIRVMVNDELIGMGALSHWEGRSIFDFLAEDSKGKIRTLLANPNDLDRGAINQLQMELNHIDLGRKSFPVRYRIDVMEDTGTILLLGRDLRPLAEAQQRLMATQLALEADSATGRARDIQMRSLMATTKEPIIFVAQSDQRIFDISQAAVALLGRDREYLLSATLAEALKLETSPLQGDQPIQVEIDLDGHMVTLIAEPYRNLSDTALICYLQDTLSKSEQTTGQDFLKLIHMTSDGYVILDEKGAIQRCNTGFLALVEAAQSDKVLGTAIRDYLGRGSVDYTVIMDAAKQAGSLRNYETKLKSQFGSALPITLSVHRLNEGPSPLYGLVFRDQSKQVSENGLDITDTAAEQLNALVGSAPLRDIVAKSTDVIEKSCIQTAIRLTNNNRVAAAEMLGLSRQSLYVKLRKYGLLDRSEG